MALLPVMKDGVPLLIGDPLVPAMAEDPCDCCGGAIIPCTPCPDGLPETVTLTVAGMVQNTFETGCPGCVGLNGTYILDNQGPNSCEFRLSVPLSGTTPCNNGYYTSMFLRVSVSSSVVSLGLDLYIGAFASMRFFGGWSRTHADCLSDLTGSDSTIGGPTDDLGIPLSTGCKHDQVTAWTLAP